MDSLFEILFVLAIVWSFIGGALGNKKKKGPPHGGRGRPPRPPGGGKEGRAPDAGHGAGPATADERASEMVPEELWEILTGQQRPQPPPPEPPVLTDPEPQPVSESEPDSWRYDDEDLVVSDPWQAESEPAPWDEERQEAIERGWISAPVDDEARSLEAPVPQPRPVVRSLEPRSIDHEARHAAFHRKIERLRRADRVHTRDEGPAVSFEGNQDLRRAIILSEILGPCKGMQ